MGPITPTMELIPQLNDFVSRGDVRPGALSAFFSAGTARLPPVDFSPASVLAHAIEASREPGDPPELILIEPGQPYCEAGASAPAPAPRAARSVKVIAPVRMEVDEEEDNPEAFVMTAVNLARPIQPPKLPKRPTTVGAQKPLAIVDVDDEDGEESLAISVRFDGPIRRRPGKK
jgi:hypothetical protein